MARKERSSIWDTALRDRHELDPLQLQILERFENAWRAMWPTVPGQRPLPPYAMTLAFAAAVELIDYTLRTDRGKAAMRKRMSKRWAGECTEPTFHGSDPDLTHNFDAAAVIPGLMAILQGGAPAPSIDTDFEAGIGDAIDGWLAGGAI